MNRRTFRLSGRADKGANLIEAALTFPVLILLLVGLVEFGRAYLQYIGMTNAVREGARYGARQPCDVPGIATAVASEMANAHADLTGCPTPTINRNQYGADNYSVSVTQQCLFSSTLGGLVGFNTITLSKSAEMRVEGPPPICP